MTGYPEVEQKGASGREVGFGEVRITPAKIGKSSRLRNGGSVCDANCSPGDGLQVGLLISGAEKKVELVPTAADASLFSAVHFGEQEWRKMAVFREFQGNSGREFSAVQTVWRSTQSGANHSPAKFPANREKYREFAKILGSQKRNVSSKLHILHAKPAIRVKPEQGINR